MKLQVALDVLSEKEALRIAKQVSKYVDIIEAGTPLIKSQGIGIVRKLKRFRKPVLADLKTMDTGFLEAELAFKNGADITTVCGAAPVSTIAGAVKAGRKYRKKVLVDLIGVKSANRAKKALKLGADYVCLHIGIDEQMSGVEITRRLQKIKKLKHVAVAGGISLKTIDKIIKIRPDIIIVGSAITKSKNPAKVAKELKERMERK